MNVAEAVELIEPAVSATNGKVWVDLGAGTGTFTEALAELLPPDALVIAVDRDASALRALRRLAARCKGADIRVAAGDVRQLAEIPELKLERAAGALFANVLHFVEHAELVLADIREYIEPDGSIVIVEYDRRGASRWVPYPLGPDALARAAQKAGYARPVEMGRRASRYQGELYCALLKT